MVSLPFPLLTGRQQLSRENGSGYKSYWGDGDDTAGGDASPLSRAIDGVLLKKILQHGCPTPVSGDSSSYEVRYKFGVRLSRH
jgi:hypothetical protein